MRRSGLAAVGAAVFACALTSCGTFVPDFAEFYDTVPPEDLIDAIVSHVHCEVKSQVEFIILDDFERTEVDLGTGQRFERKLKWLDDWGAQVMLTLTVDEKTTLSPGVTLNKVLPNVVTPFSNGNVTSPQSINISFGAGGSADATRKAVISWFIDFREFTKEGTEKPSVQEKLKAAGKDGTKTPAKKKSKPDTLTKELVAASRVYAQLRRQAREAGTGQIGSICNGPRDSPRGVLIEGDLKFREWLLMVLTPAFPDNAVTGDFAQDLQNEIKVSKKDVLQNQITFVMQYSGNVTPTWKLARFSANPSGTLFNAQRTRTQDLVITLSPAPNDSQAAAAQSAQNAALAAAIASAIRGNNNNP